jgi:hypothetical protein
MAIDKDYTHWAQVVTAAGFCWLPFCCTTIASCKTKVDIVKMGLYDTSYRLMVLIFYILYDTQPHNYNVQTAIALRVSISPYEALPHIMLLVEVSSCNSECLTDHARWLPLGHHGQMYYKFACGYTSGRYIWKSNTNEGSSRSVLSKFIFNATFYDLIYDNFRGVWCKTLIF